MDNSKKHELIESYLANKMPEEQRRDFEEQLGNNKELFNEVRLNRELAALLGNERLQKFLETVNETDTNWKLSPKEKKSVLINMNTRFILAIAASLAIIIFTWQIFFVSGEDPAAKQLFSEFFEPYQMVLSQRSEADTSGHVNLMNLAVQEYTSGNYSSAADAFQQLSKFEPENISYMYYNALSLLGSNKGSEAIEILEEVLHTKGHLFTEQSLWYLALAYILADDEEKALDLLKAIKPGEFHFAESREIISELE
jgi:tetratricopeptide (TPR) repeat protein